MTTMKETVAGHARATTMHRLLHPYRVLIAIQRAYQKTIEESVQDAQSLFVLRRCLYESCAIQTSGQCQGLVELNLPETFVLEDEVELGANEDDVLGRAVALVGVVLDLAHCGYVCGLLVL